MKKNQDLQKLAASQKSFGHTVYF